MTEANAGWAHSTIVKEGGLWSVYAWSASLGGRGLQNQSRSDQTRQTIQLTLLVLITCLSSNLLIIILIHLGHYNKIS